MNNLRTEGSNFKYTQHSHVNEVNFVSKSNKNFQPTATKITSWLTNMRNVWEDVDEGCRGMYNALWVASAEFVKIRSVIFFTQKRYINIAVMANWN